MVDRDRVWPASRPLFHHEPSNHHESYRTRRSPPTRCHNACYTPSSTRLTRLSPTWSQDSSRQARSTSTSGPPPDYCNYLGRQVHSLSKMLNQRPAVGLGLRAGQHVAAQLEDEEHLIEHVESTTPTASRRQKVRFEVTLVRSVWGKTTAAMLTRSDRGTTSKQ